MTEAQRSDWDGLPLDEPVMLIHQVTGTYLQTQTEKAETLESGLQNEHHWPLPDDKTFQWRLRPVKTKGGTSCLLLNESKGHAATLTETDPKKIPVTTPLMKTVDGNSGSLTQHWEISPIQGVSGFWAIVPWISDNFALGPLSNACANDQWIVPTSNYGKPCSFFHAWRILRCHEVVN